jgi:hypothetical protein
MLGDKSQRCRERVCNRELTADAYDGLGGGGRRTFFRNWISVSVGMPRNETVVLGSEVDVRSGLLNVPLAPDHLVLIAPVQQSIAVDNAGSVSFGEIFSHKLIAVRERALLTQFISRIG